MLSATDPIASASIKLNVEVGVHYATHNPTSIEALFFRSSVLPVCLGLKRFSPDERKGK